MGILENLGIKMFFFCRAHLEKNWFQKFEIVHYVQTNGSWYLCQICQRVDADVFLYYYYHTDNRIVTSTQKWIKRVDVNQKMLVRCPTA